MVVRRNLIVIETGFEYFVVVMDELKDKYRIRTAFPSNKGYVDKRIKSIGVNVGTWGK